MLRKLRIHDYADSQGKVHSFSDEYARQPYMLINTDMVVFAHKVEIILGSSTRVPGTALILSNGFTFRVREDQINIDMLESQLAHL